MLIYYLGAFVLVKATKEKMSFTYLNTKGETIYSNLTIYPKSDASCIKPKGNI